MSGIVCVYNHKIKADNRIVQDMVNALAHRGPSAKMVRVEFDGKLGMGHTRLCLDPSERVNQPMMIDDYTLVLDGEIYNHAS